MLGIFVSRAEGSLNSRDEWVFDVEHVYAVGGVGEVFEWIGLLFFAKAATGPRSAN